MNEMCNLSGYVKEIGIKEGMELGIQQGRYSIIRNMLNRGMSDADIMALVECSQEFLDEVRKESKNN
jgi:hypothetical protein